MDALAHRLAVGRRFSARIADGDAVFLAGLDGVVALPYTVSGGIDKPMSGPNLFILLQVMKDKGWSDSRFFTADQVEKSGWEVKPLATSIRLQYLVSTGPDGLPLVSPASKVFQVFNASDIDGVPAVEPSVRVSYEGVIKIGDTLRYSESAAVKAGFEDWFQSVENLDLISQSGLHLTLGLASLLVEVQTGINFNKDNAQYLSYWVQMIEADPLSFFQAVNDAEKLAASVMVQVQARAVEINALLEVSENSNENKRDADMARKNTGANRVARLFAEREAVLAVPFDDKERAVALGARWSPVQKLWFVPAGLDVNNFKEWDPRAHVLGAVASRDMLLDEFRDAMNSLGLDASGDIKDDGKWHNVSVDSKNGKNLSGSYILSMDGGRDGDAIGTILNKHTGEQFTWTHKGALLTPEQRARMRADVIAREEIATREALVLQDVAAGHANEIWAVGKDASQHDYVVKKGVNDVDDIFRQVPGEVLLKYSEFKSETGTSVIRASENYLLVPMHNEAGELRALQAINADGSVKSFMRGGQKKGTMLVIGAASFNDAVNSNSLTSGESFGSMLAYAEGVATGASFNMASGMPVVVCFDAGNLETVVAQTAWKLPVGLNVVIAADNDQFYVERAMGFLSDKLGLNPHVDGGQVFKVLSGLNESREVSLGEAVADGEWHLSAKGNYRISTEHYDVGDTVRSVKVEVVPTGARAMSSFYENRGVEAARTAKIVIEAVGREVVLAIPTFRALEGRPTDWNDLVKREGLSSARVDLDLIEGLELSKFRSERELPVLERGRARSVGIER